MTVTDPESIGIRVDGDSPGRLLQRRRDAITNGGTSTQINGDDAGKQQRKTTVDGKDFPGTEIAGK